MTHGLVYSMAESAQHLLAFLDCFQKGRDIVWALEGMRRGGIDRGRYKPADRHEHPDNGFVCAAMEWTTGSRCQHQTTKNAFMATAVRRMLS